MYRITEKNNYFIIEKKFGIKWKPLRKNKQIKTFDDRDSCQLFLDKRISKKLEELK